MNRTGRTLLMGCLSLAAPLLASAGDNSLLVPSVGRCALNATAEELPQALAACEEIARQGDSLAQYELGEFFYDGKRVPRDLPQARHWFEQSSLQGNAEAQLRLGTMFYLGEGVPASNVQAYIVLKMAAVNGSDEAMDSADQVAEHMQREELQAASQVLGQIFRDYLLELRNIDGNGSVITPTQQGITPQAPALAP